MIEQAHRILMQVPCSVGYHREEGNVEGREALYGCVCLRYLTSAVTASFLYSLAMKHELIERLSWFI
jgi:hypothetical protein